MSEESARNDSSSERRRTPETTWTAPEQYPVYGLTRGVPPPDLQNPWEFYPPEEPAREEGLQQQNPLPPPAPMPPQPPQHTAPPPKTPPPKHCPPQVPPPPPIGPALTPEERWAQLHGEATPPQTPPQDKQ